MAGDGPVAIVALVVACLTALSTFIWACKADRRATRAEGLTAEVQREARAQRVADENTRLSTDMREPRDWADVGRVLNRYCGLQGISRWQNHMIPPTTVPPLEVLGSMLLFWKLLCTAIYDDDIALDLPMPFPMGLTPSMETNLREFALWYINTGNRFDLRGDTPAPGAVIRLSLANYLAQPTNIGLWQTARTQLRLPDIVAPPEPPAYFG
jgi:hypothetical protein